MGYADVLARDSLTGTRWSVQVRDPGTGEVHFEDAPRALLRTASVAKLFVLVEVAERLATGELTPARLLRRDRVAPVADSGLWQHLDVAELPVTDVARLVGAVSDNWATNVLLDVVGLDTVRTRARRTAPGGSTLHDAVRDVRTAADPPTLSEGCAADWTSVLARLHDGTAASPAACATVLQWLATGTDLSMVASAFGLDPLAHAAPDRGVRLWSKTGTSEGVRADVGLVSVGSTSRTYAAICNWDPADSARRDDVLAAMRALGAVLAHDLGAPTAS